MIFNFISVCTVAGVILHLYSQPSHLRTKKRIVEIFLLYLLSIQWGIGAVFSSIPHIVIPDTVADYIGWQRGSPFQIELGFAALGLAILGVLSIWLRGAFWVAPAIGRSVFLLGAAYVHIRDIVTRGNFAPGNAGSIFIFRHRTSYHRFKPAHCIYPHRRAKTRQPSQYDFASSVDRKVNKRN